MGKHVTVTKLDKISTINLTEKYDGQIFIVKNEIYMILNGKPVKIKSNLNDYIKKTELDKYLKEHYPKLFEESGE